jgi:sugar lactone lactonase YvrE
MEQSERVVSVTAELALDARAELGEGALWDAAGGVLLWIDITGHLVHRFNPVTGQNTTMDVGQPVGAVVLATDGRLMLAVEKGFAFLDLVSGRLETIATVEPGQPTRMNDGKCDSRGRFWAGTMAYAETKGAGSLYRLDPDRLVTRVLEQVTISNGIAWSLDDRAMYYIDTPLHTVDRFAFDAASGGIGARSTVVRVDPSVGSPDGMTVDAEGHLWVAMWGGSSVRRYTPTGVLELVVEVPASRVTSCAFGGDSLDELFITTASTGLTDVERAAQPLAGGLFRVRPGVKGMTAQVFRG